MEAPLERTPRVVERRSWETTLFVDSMFHPPDRYLLSNHPVQPSGCFLCGAGGGRPSAKTGCLPRHFLSICQVPGRNSVCQSLSGTKAMLKGTGHR